MHHPGEPRRPETDGQGYLLTEECCRWIDIGNVGECGRAELGVSEARSLAIEGDLLTGRTICVVEDRFRGESAGCPPDVPQAGGAVQRPLSGAEGGALEAREVGKFGPPWNSHSAKASDKSSGICHSGGMAGGLAGRVRTGLAFGGSLVLACALVLTEAGTAQADSRRNAERVLNALPVSVERSSGYDRDLFDHWSDLDDDGCNTREEVLIQERIAGSVSGCDVVGGRWRSAYDRDVTRNSSSFDIDHFVPLKEAWDSGAWRWNPRTRERFANDLGYRGSLIAVSASSNRSKSDRDPTDWLPEYGKCKYAKTWIAVKFRWRLAVDSNEKSALSRILRGCSPNMRVPSLARVVTR